jgi:hypothetical protein
MGNVLRRVTSGGMLRKDDTSSARVVGSPSSPSLEQPDTWVAGASTRVRPRPTSVREAGALRGGLCLCNVRLELRLTV